MSAGTGEMMAGASAVRVALIDGPLPADHPAVECVVDVTEGALTQSPAGRHAEAVAGAILAAAPAVRLVSIAVFAGRLAARADGLEAALAAAAECGAPIVHCSLGLARYDPALAASVASLVAQGRIVVAAAGARGGAVWPASFPGVIAVQGDARCAAGEWSRLTRPPADYGAAPRSTLYPRLGGASIAAAHLTGILARRAPSDREAARRMLDAGALYHGAERRGAAADR